VSPPTVTGDQMRAIDDLMVEAFHIELLQMMENAGRNLGDLALHRFHPADVMLLVGTGGNGGGGLVAARHLANRGVTITVALADQELTPAATHQLDIVTRMGIDILDHPRPAELVIDALIGYSLRGDPSGTAAALIRWANRQAAPILALDTPSGLDVTTGRAADPCVSATATMTLAAPKRGLIHAPEVGDLYLADISVPPAAYQRTGIDAPVRFGAGPLVRVRQDQQDARALADSNDHRPRAR
jgi:NAD(P)H-hydrate epimerase